MTSVDAALAKVRAQQAGYDAAKAADLTALKVRIFDRINKIADGPNEDMLTLGRVLETLEPVRAIQKAIRDYEAADKEYKRLLGGSEPS